MLFKVEVIKKRIIEQKILFITLCKAIILNKSIKQERQNRINGGVSFFIVQECQIIIKLV